MPRSITLSAGPFDKGLNTVVDPALLAPNEAVQADGVEITSGTLRGFYGPGTALSGVSVSATAKFIHYAASDAWISNYQLHGYLPVRAFDDASPSSQGSRITYMADIDGTGTVQPSKVIIGASTYRLGIAAPTSGSASGGTGDARAYAVTFYCSDTGVESNAYDLGTANTTGATLTIPVHSDATNDPNRTNVQRWIYATQALDTSGTKYLLHKVTNNTATSYSTTGSETLSTSVPLDWGTGLEEDHSPAPSMTNLTDSIHSVNEGQGAPGSGIVVGATDNWLTWSRLGYPHYWPTRNYIRLSAQVGAIISMGSQTFVFTADGVFSLSGIDDATMDFRKTSAAHGLDATYCRTVVQTPHGILYWHREGVILFDGSSSRCISKGLLNSSDLSPTCATFFDGYYLLSTPAGVGVGYVHAFDMRSFPNALVVTKLDLDAVAFHVTQQIDAGTGQLWRGLYVSDYSGDVKPWMPLSETLVTGQTRMAWTFKSGRITGGDVTRQKRFRRFRLRKSGTMSVSLYVDSESTARATRTTTGWLPMSMVGYTLTWKATSSDGTGELLGIEVQAEVLDGA